MAKNGKKYKFKGLDDIFGESVGSVIDVIQSNPTEANKLKDEILVSEIKANPDQPRKTFDKEQIEELAISIKANGLIQPIIITEENIIVAGERRFKAVQSLGWKTISAIKLKLTQQQIEEYSIIENIQRVDLLPIEEAIAYKRLTKNFGMTQEDISSKVGKSRSHVANIIRLLNLPEYIQDSMLKGDVSMGQAKPLLSITNQPDKIKSIYNMIVKNNLTSRDVENLIKKLSNSDSSKNGGVKQQKTADIISIEDKMVKRFKTSVSIDNKKIIIKYGNVEDLNRILELMDLID